MSNVERTLEEFEVSSDDGQRVRVRKSLVVHVLSNPNDPVTNAAPVFDPVTGLLNNGVNLTSTGAVSPDRSKPKNAGFGVATAYQTPRNVQLQVRFSF